MCINNNPQGAHHAPLQGGAEGRRGGGGCSPHNNQSKALPAGLIPGTSKSCRIKGWGVREERREGARTPCSEREGLPEQGRVEQGPQNCRRSRGPPQYCRGGTPKAPAKPGAGVDEQSPVPPLGCGSRQEGPPRGHRPPSLRRRGPKGR